MSAALDRQIRPIYDALDTGSNKSAIVACNKLLKKNPKNDLIKALKALALVRSQKVEESLVLCDNVLASKPTDDSVLTAMMHVLRGLGRHVDMVTMFEEAFKQQPTNEELGAQTFFANVRAGHWKSAQQAHWIHRHLFMTSLGGMMQKWEKPVLSMFLTTIHAFWQIATRMHKHFQEDRYLYWSVISTILQANDTATLPNMRTLLYKLAHRLITSSPTPSYLNADRFHLHLSILRELGLFDEAHRLLSSDIGRSICATSLSCNEIRRDIWRLRGLLKEEGEQAELQMVEKNDRNWLEFLSVLDATFSYIAISQDGVSPEASESVRMECSENIVRTRDLFTRLAEEDGKKDRSALLALLELEKRARTHGLSTDKAQMVNLMERYFQNISDKACCFEDLKPYLGLRDDDLSRWTAILESYSPSFTTSNDLRRLTNIHKILRHDLSDSQLTVERESTRAARYTDQYYEGLKLGAELPATELQPADDLAILAGNVFVSLWKLTNNEHYLYNAVAFLEFALTRSKQSFQIRLMLIRIYRLLGAPSLALEHYRAMQIKQVQHDTLSHFILSRASTYSLAATGDLTLATECLESSQIYLSNSQETGDFVVRAFTSEKYSQIPELIAFEDRLDNSLQRDKVKMEHVRMRISHELISSDIIDMELIELKFIFDRFHHDNRDFEILPNYQPRTQATFNQHTLLFEKPEGLGWLWVFLKLYIRAFQQASDLDDTVEEKLLIGDRPKQSSNPENRLPLRERLLQRKEADLEELTRDELSLVDYGSALAEWLEPYHDHARPPPAVVLAEAAKQTEIKTGHPLKGVRLPQNGLSTNGNGKKEEAPPVKEPPELVSQFFDKMKRRFSEVRDKSSPSEALHVATLVQEAFVLFVILTLRFKSPSVVKVHKLGALVQSLKDLRANAISILREISSQLVKKSEQEGTTERRKSFVDACATIVKSDIDHEFLLGIAKKVTDARKKVVEGVGKGIARVCTTYTH